MCPVGWGSSLLSVIWHGTIKPALLTIAVILFFIGISAVIVLLASLAYVILIEFVSIF